MAIIKWGVKELLTALKMNNTTLRRATPAEQVAELDVNRLAGDLYHNSTDKMLEIYQGGAGSTFDITEITNFIFKSDLRIGIGAVEEKIWDIETHNMRGVSNNRIIVNIDYLAFVSLAGSVKVTVKDGTTPITVTDSFSSDPTPVDQFFRFVIDTTAYTIDDILNIKVLGTNVNINNVEMRCV